MYFLSSNSCRSHDGVSFLAQKPAGFNCVSWFGKKKKKDREKTRERNYLSLQNLFVLYFC